MSQNAEKSAGLPETPGPPPLPPVEPPTAGFVVQLFILPFVVVAVVVLVYLLFGRLAGGDRDVLDYVQEIRSSNENRRWRAALELASLIQNDQRLAGDPTLLGTLAEELDRALAERGENPNLRQYLTRTLGAFRVTEGRLPDGSRVDALAVLAEALDHEQPAEVRFAAAESLGRLASRDAYRLEHPEAVAALAEVLDDRNATPELRQLAAFALGFFGGDEAVAGLREAVVGGEPDRSVRYNAAAALGHRGDLAALSSLREMLRPSDLRRAVRMDDEETTRRKIEVIHLEALRALQDAVRRGNPELARRLRPEVEALTDSELATVRTEAVALLQLLQDAEQS